MNEKTNIDDLLRQMPLAQTNPGFTEKLLLRLETASLTTSSRKNIWSIIGIGASSILMIGFVLGCGIYFFGWHLIDMAAIQNAYLSFFRNISDIVVKFSRFRLPPAIWSGFIAGILLLLIDVAVRKRKSAKHKVEHSSVK